MTTRPIIATTRPELAEALSPGTSLATVMTMGALHSGHVELMRHARVAVGATGTVLTTIFVNPAQFGPNEDFERYPRTLDDDVAACAEAGVDIVFAPSVEQVYGEQSGPSSDAITIDPGPLGDILEGAARPGHFRGVLTVVSKLLSMTAPDVALFGEKDYQQLVLIRRMVRDLNLTPRIVGVPTVRESDGLALSSRNRYLSEADRQIAATLPRALNTVVSGAVDGAPAAMAAGKEVVAATTGITLDYLEVVAPDLGAPPVRGEARVLIAARVGGTRLIDNMPCWLGPR